MKSYTITVNGNVYEVTVEEGIKTSPAAAVQAAPQPKAEAPKKAPAAPQPKAEAPKKAPAAPQPMAAPAGAEGSVKVSAPMPGKIISVKVAPGQEVKSGDVVLILEAMKMENEIVAPQDGVIAAVHVNAGSSVEAGDVLVSLD